MQRTLTDSFILSIGYVLFAWAVLALAAPALIAAFEAKGESAQYVAFYCRYGVSAWLFLACLFVANAAFNNLGFPVLVDGVQLGAGDARDDSVRDRSARVMAGVQGGSHGLRAWLRRVRPHRRRDAYAVTWRLAKAIDGGGRALARAPRRRSSTASGAANAT